MEYTDNVFLNAMDTDQQMSIQEIKANKVFALKLIIDLDKVFQTNYEILDDENNVLIRMKRFVSNNWYNSFTFNVNKNGITFNCWVDCMRSTKILVQLLTIMFFVNVHQVMDGLRSI